MDERGDAGAPLLCTLSLAQADARCVALPASVLANKQGLRLLGTSDDGAAPLIFAGNRGSEGIFRGDSGELVEKLYAYGGYSATDGFAAVLGWDEKARTLVATRKAAGGVASHASIDSPFRIGNAFYSSQAARARQ